MNDFRFIDLFAGIGGFRIALESVGGKCVFSSDNDKFAQQTYHANFGEIPYGDIRSIDKKDIPDHDVLCAGFPCQPFSIASIPKRNSLGMAHGFTDTTRGTLFFDVAEVIHVKRPKVFFLENVKNLLSHDKGNTFRVISDALTRLGYEFNFKVVDGANWTPQHRERIFIVGYDKKRFDIEKERIIIPLGPLPGYQYPKLRTILNKFVSGYTLGDGTWNALKAHKARHAAKGNGFGYSLVTFPIAEDKTTRTMSARYHKDGGEILIEQAGDNPRKLTIEEAMQLQGYDPKTFKFPVSRTQAYKQIGNSVVIPAIQATAREISKVLTNYRQNGASTSETDFKRMAQVS
tara:strand:- start:1452 stop:2489 length:1038 start_codon:yes stop_codon:yes gene_type:complete